jgi:hypothetical protein
MIDISTEHLIPIRDVPHHLPPRPTGRRVHVSAVYRWILRGVRGVRLETIRIGGTSYTSAEALQRFADGLNASSSNELTARPTTSTRRKQIERAEREVQAILGDDPRSGS